MTRASPAARSAPAKPPTLQQGALALECLGFAGAVAADVSWVFGRAPAHGLPGLLGTLELAVGPGAASVAILRRLLPDRLEVIGWLTVFVSFATSVAAAAVRGAGRSVPPQLFLSELLALAVLMGAACRRLERWQEGIFPVCGGVAMLGVPLLRDAGSAWALLAAPAAQLWGLAIGAGLLLRDVDRRIAAQLAGARVAERFALARDLHDTVIHYVTGIVVRTQAARVVGSMAPDGIPEDQATYYDEIEEAGANAVQAMRHLVGMLREDAADNPANLREAVLLAVGDDERVRLLLPPDADRLARSPELATTVHRVILESLTNARRHAPQASYVDVAVRVEQDVAGSVLLLEIVNDGAADLTPAPASTTATSGGRNRRGFGLLGMRERVRAMGGTIRSGPEPDGRWSVVARLPLSAAGTVPPFLSEV
ncbi:sensor histidine kinase [Phaeacidiphilus oryzae]|uniref:sensor histidine kinase n=1 Tax=Phaeacidiphilus oryzae TaxID=348818 RepID=UPI00068FC13E|nr:ATP-binding protein [Phaeacidiphilus oryzae]